MAFYDMLLGFAAIGFSTSMIPPEIGWPLGADGVDWLEEWPGPPETSRLADG